MRSLILGFYRDSDLSRDDSPLLQAVVGLRTAINGCSLHLLEREMRLSECLNLRTSW